MQHQYMFLVVSDSSLGPAFPNYCCYSTTPTDNVDSPLDLLRIKQGLPFQLVDVKVIIGKNIRKFEKLQLSNHPLSCLSHRKFFFVYFSANSMFWGCSLHFLCVLCSLYLIFVTFKLKQFFHRIIWLGSNFNVSRILLFDFSLFAQSVQWEKSVLRVNFTAYVPLQLSIVLSHSLSHLLSYLWPGNLTSLGSHQIGCFPCGPLLKQQ